MKYVEKYIKDARSREEWPLTAYSHRTSWHVLGDRRAQLTPPCRSRSWQLMLPFSFGSLTARSSWRLLDSCTVTIRLSRGGGVLVGVVGGGGGGQAAPTQAASSKAVVLDLDGCGAVPKAAAPTDKMPASAKTVVPLGIMVVVVVVVVLLVVDTKEVNQTRLARMMRKRKGGFWWLDS